MRSLTRTDKTRPALHSATPRYTGIQRLGILETNWL